MNCSREEKKTRPKKGENRSKRKKSREESEHNESHIKIDV